MGAGGEVVVVSPRATAAHLHAPLSGSAAARTLLGLRRSTGSEALVMCVEPGMPLSRGTGGLRMSIESRLLRAAMRRFSRVTLLSGERPDAISAELRALARAADEIVVDSAEDEDLVTGIVGRDGPAVRVEETAPRQRGEPSEEGVTLFGPPETDAQGVSGHVAARMERAAYYAEHAGARVAHLLLGDNARKIGKPLRRVFEPVRARLIRSARRGSA